MCSGSTADGFCKNPVPYHPPCSGLQSQNDPSHLHTHLDCCWCDHLNPRPQSVPPTLAPQQPYPPSPPRTQPFHLLILSPREDLPTWGTHWYGFISMCQYPYQCSDVVSTTIGLGWSHLICSYVLLGYWIRGLLINNWWDQEKLFNLQLLGIESVCQLCLSTNNKHRVTRRWCHSWHNNTELGLSHQLIIRLAVMIPLSFW